MSEWIMTPQELLYCAAQTGSQRFFGMDDPFYAMEPEEIRAVIPRLQQSLEQKGVAQLGFDDSFTLLPRAAEVVKICADCQRYLLLRCTQQQSVHRVRVYFKEDKAVIAADVQNGVSLQETPVGAVAEQLIQVLPVAGDGIEAAEEAQLAYTLLANVQKKATDNAGAAQDLLVQQGVSEGLAARLVYCLSRDVAKAELCKGDLRKRSLDTAVLLFDEKGIICMMPTDVEEQIWHIRPAALPEIETVVTKFVKEVAEV